MKKLAPLILTACILSPLAGEAQVQQYYWNGAGNDHYWNTPLNFSRPLISSYNSEIVFNGSVRPANENNIDGLLAHSISFAVWADAQTLSGKGVTLWSGVYNGSSKTQRIALPLTFVRSQVLNSFHEEGVIELTSNVIFDGTESTNPQSRTVYLSIRGDGNTIISGNMTERTWEQTGTISKEGSGTLTLSGVNTFTGGLEIYNGTVDLQSKDAVKEYGSIFVRGRESFLINSKAEILTRFIYLENHRIEREGRVEIIANTGGNLTNDALLSSDSTFTLLSLTGDLSVLHNTGTIRNISAPPETPSDQRTTIVDTGKRNTVTNSGGLISSIGGSAIRLSGSGSTLVNDEEGRITGGRYGVELRGSNTLTNKGKSTIKGGVAGVMLSYGATLVNEGGALIEASTITGDGIRVSKVDISPVQVTITNSATAGINGGADGAHIRIEDVGFLINNAGEIGTMLGSWNAVVVGGEAHGTLFNEGTIRGSVTFTQGTTGGNRYTLALGSQGEITGPVEFGSNPNAVLALRGTNDYSLSEAIKGVVLGFRGHLKMEGTQTWTIDKTLSSLGRVSVESGTLIVGDNRISGGTVQVLNGGRLELQGRAGNQVILNAGGHLLADRVTSRQISTGAMEIKKGGNLHLTPGETQIHAGTAFSIETGALLHLSGGAGLTPGSYDFIAYTTSLGGNPSGAYFLAGQEHRGLDFALDTATTGEVNLQVSTLEDFYWNGTTTIPNGQINAASGTWTNDTPNWTNASGTLSTYWNDGGNAHFLSSGDTLRTVTLGNPVEVRDFTFAGVWNLTNTETGNYAISLVHDEDRLFSLLHAEEGASVDLDVALSQAGPGTGLRVTGPGTIRLAGSNYFTGGLEVHGGNVILANSGAHGQAPSGDWLAEVNDGGVLELENGHSFVFDKPISASEGAVVSNKGTVVAGAFALDGGTFHNQSQGTITASAPDFRIGEEGGVFINDGVTKGLSVTYMDDGPDAPLRTLRIDNFRTMAGLLTSTDADIAIELNNKLEEALIGGVSLASAAIDNSGTIGSPGVGVAITGNATASLINRHRIIGDVELASDTSKVTLHQGSQITGDLTFSSNATSTLLTLVGTGEEKFSEAVKGVTAFGGTLVKQGSGSWWVDSDLAGGNAVDLQAGTLYVTALLGGEMLVHAGATLAGSGRLGGEVTVNSGGHLFPGTPEGGATLQVQSLVLGIGSVTHWTLGATPASQLAVDERLLLAENALFNLTTVSGFDEGRYLLFTYGELDVQSGRPLFARAPAGYSLELDYSEAHEIWLEVGEKGLQFWNGTQTSAIHRVEGGDGTWNATLTNWTNRQGNVAHEWNRQSAVFAGAKGTVTVEGEQLIEGLHFVTSGYTLTGGESGTPGSLELAAGEVRFVLDSEVIADLDLALAGSGKLVQIGAGELTLSHANSHLGGTEVYGGRLILAADGALGSGGLSVTGAESSARILAGVNLVNAVALHDAASFENYGELETASNAITATGRSTILNEGTISSSNGEAIRLEKGGEVINRGRVISDLAVVSLGGPVSITNVDGGEMGGVSVSGGGTILNHGTISKTTTGPGISLHGVAATLINHGTIEGGLLLDGEAHQMTLHSGSTLSGGMEMGNSQATGLTLTGAAVSQIYSDSVVDSMTGFSGTLRKEGAGGWTLDRDDFGSVTRTDIHQGRLDLQGVTLGGSVNVKAGSTLGGTGTLTAQSGATTIEAGGRLELANSDVAWLVLNRGSITRVDLTLQNPLIARTGRLQIDQGALFDLQLNSAVEAGSYHLFSYTNELTPLAPVPFFLGAPAGYNLSLDTSIANEVYLALDFVGLQFWNDSQFEPTGSVHGGSGIWKTGDSNWTNSGGSASSSWAGKVAVFAGSSGVVTVEGNQSIEGLHFATDGYELTSDSGSLELALPATELRINAGLSAALGVELIGSGGLVKTGEGSIVLESANHYHGSTTVASGQLVQASAGALPAGSDLILHGGALLLTAYDLSATSLSGDGGAVDLGTATLTLQQMSDTHYAGGSRGDGSLVKSGSGTLEITGTLEHTGATVVREGTLAAGHLASSHLRLEGGRFSPGGNVAASYSVGSLTLDGGEFHFQLNAAGQDHLLVGDGAAQLLSATRFTFSTGGLAPTGLFTLITGLGTGWDLSLLSYSGLGESDARFLLSDDGKELLLSVYQGEPIGGAILQNSAPVGTPLNANFVVEGAVTTGRPDENNTVASLRFAPSSELKVHQQLTVSSGSVHVGEGQARLTGGSVVTPGDFAKTGGGVLDLESNLRTGGSALVEEGALYVNAHLEVTGGLTVAQAAFLGGSGTVEGNVINHGRINPGNSPGTLVFTGDFLQPAGGVLEIEVFSHNQHDRLEISGVATLGGTLLAYGPGLTYGSTVGFLNAQGGIVGSFDQIAVPVGLRARVFFNGGKGSLLIAPRSYAQLAPGGNAGSVARALDGFVNAKGGDRAEISLALDRLEASEYAKAFQAIAPTFYESLGQIRSEQGFSHLQQLNIRLGSGVRPAFQSIGLTPTLTHDRNGEALFTPAPDHRWGLWAEGNGLFAKTPSLHQLPGYRFESGGFTVGGDYRWSENFTTGLYGGYQYTRAGSSVGGQTRIDSALFGGYASYVQNGFHANLLIGGGADSYDLRRPIRFSGVDRTARTSPDGTQFNTALHLGYEWQLGPVTLGPIAGVSYTQTWIDGLNETGAQSLNLRLDRQRIESLRTVLGARLASRWEAAPGVALSPELRLSWQREHLNTPRTLHAALDGGSGPSFDYETQSPMRDRLLLSTGVSAELGERWNASLFYQASFGEGEALSNMVSGGIGWKF